MVADSVVCAPSYPSTRAKLVTTELARVIGLECAALTSFFLLLATVPSFAGGRAAGLMTASLMISTLAAEFACPRVLARFGYRRSLAGALVLLGAASFALLMPMSNTGLAVSCAVRGVGFGLIMVACAALAAEILPAQNRGEGLGIYGVLSGLPSVIALPVGLGLSEWCGYPVVFVAAGLSALTGLALLPRRSGRAVAIVCGPAKPTRTWRQTGLRRPALVLGATTAAGGIVVTFLPLALDSAGEGLIAVGLLLHMAAALVTRWWAGRFCDRNPGVALLGPGLLATATGLMLLVYCERPVVMLAAMLLTGLGFGITQSASLALMFQRAPVTAYGQVSAMWNVAYDAGLGIGAAGFGLLVGPFGYPGAFAVAALLVLLAVIPAARPAPGL